MTLYMLFCNTDDYRPFDIFLLISCTEKCVYRFIFSDELFVDLRQFMKNICKAAKHHKLRSTNKGHRKSFGPFRPSLINITLFF